MFSPEKVTAMGPREVTPHSEPGTHISQLTVISGAGIHPRQTATLIVIDVGFNPASPWTCYHLQSGPYQL